ncbi:hypothetical protein E2562_017599 [Oryza meyeriana var. granulata]|uniref:Aminotransferase-like plant mobile domain-containing protein n=1 Tax=Oryza meyeriana var. granulata TaxID=110450 RepID=A0A6G1BLB4_9ORYZ|nr:hypothetical protein E2562_017599 [Oryza meyeriana var. granulata]
MAADEEAPLVEQSTTAIVSCAGSSPDWPASSFPARAAPAMFSRPPRAARGRFLATGSGWSSRVAWLAGALEAVGGEPPAALVRLPVGGGHGDAGGRGRARWAAPAGRVRDHAAAGHARRRRRRVEAVQTAIHRTKTKNSACSAWLKHFLRPQQDEEAAAAAAGGGGREDAEAFVLLEHGAFLATWFSLYVLPAPPFRAVRSQVFPIAARLVRGQAVALAPAALASIYNDLTALKRHLVSGKGCQPFVG